MHLKFVSVFKYINYHKEKKNQRIIFADYFVAEGQRDRRQTFPCLEGIFVFLKVSMPSELEANKELGMVKSSVGNTRWQGLKFRLGGCVVLEKLIHLSALVFSLKCGP